MSYRVVLLAQAEREAEAIAHWICERSPQGAARWIDAFDAMIQRLADNPYLFGVAPENHLVNYEVRQALFKTPRGRTYRALFTIVGNQVRVLHIRGPGQKPLKSDKL